MDFKPSFFAIQSSGILLSLATIVVASPAFADSALDVKSPESSLSGLIPGEALPVQQAANPVGDGLQNTEVNPTEQEIKILQELRARYQCSGIDGQEKISRSQFTEKLESCIDNLEGKLAQNQNSVSSSDLEQIKQLANSFQDDARALSDRIQKIETKLAQASNSSFSTTTKLAGEVIIGLNTFGGAPASTSSRGSGTTVTDRVRLNLLSTFDGKDQLYTRIEARNTAPFNAAVTGTNLTRLGWDGDEANASYIPKLQYSKPIDSKAKIIVDALGGEFNDNFYNFNTNFSSAGTGSISRFGRFNPVYRLSGLGTGANLEYKFSDQLTASLAYAVPGVGTPLAAIAANPNDGNGIFNGSNVIFSQLRYQASPQLDLGLIYARSYHTDGNNVAGGTGSALANRPFGNNRTTADHLSVLASTKVSSNVVLSGWAGFTGASREGTDFKADIFNAAISAAFTDVGAKGNVLGFVFGIPPKINGIWGVANPNRNNTPLHLEALYKIKVSNNLDITPGLLLVTSPDTATKETEYVGTVRTTFRF